MPTPHESAAPRRFLARLRRAAGPSPDDRAVFIVGVGLEVLSLVRIFGSRGVPCFVCSSSRGVPGALSRWAQFRRIPDPRDDEQGMVDALIALARTQRLPPVIFTGSDQHAQALARHRDRLRAVAIPCIARAEVVDLLTHKARFSAWARENGTSHPESVPATEFRAGASLPFPVVAKPNHRGFSDAAKRGLPSEEQLHERRFTLIRSALEWEAFRERERSYLPHLLIQEYVQGTSASKYSVCVYADADSQIRALFVGRRLRGFPALYGDASLVQSDEVPDGVTAEVSHIVKSLGYEGIAEFEFNQDERTGEFRLLEINPRCWGWIGITGVTACNVPWIAFRDLTGASTDGGTVYGPARGSTKLLYLTLDVANVFLRYRSDRPSWVMSPLRWWRSLRADELVVWEIDSRDWQGTLSSFWLLLRKALRYSQRRPA